MKPLPTFSSSYPIEVVPYQSTWPKDFEKIAQIGCAKDNFWEHQASVANFFVFHVCFLLL